MDFIRSLKPSHDTQGFFHFTPEVNELGKPAVIEKAPFNPINLPSFFKQDKNIEIEIGCGKGNFMEDYCTAFPHLSFLGIEQEPSIAYLAAKRMQRNPQKYAMVLHSDAFYFFKEKLNDNTVQTFHMYFPDPWPKKKHHKRRLLHLDYLNQVKRIAIPNAQFHWRTDYQEYHKSALEVFESLPWVEPLDKQPFQEFKTNFEKKYIQEKRPIYRFSFRIKK